VCPFPGSVFNDIFRDRFMPRKPSIDNLRVKIDTLDKRIVKLLNERAHAAIQIGEVKRENDQPIFVPSREEKVLRKVAKDSAQHGFLSEEAIRNVYSEVISACRSAEKHITVAFLGPAGTFSHQAARAAKSTASLARHAARRRFGSSIDLIPVNGIDAVFAEVSQERAQYGVVPVENSTEGGIGTTLDCFMDTDLKVSAEVLVNVHHSLMTKSSPDDIKKIYSKDVVFGQCKSWLSNHFPNAQLIPAASTARAAELASRTKGAASIGHEEAAGHHGLTVLHRKIEDNPFNMTRFYVVAKEDGPRTGKDKTSIICFIKDQPGALHRILMPFKGEVNLTKIESWPSKRKAWDYCFFIDFDGHRNERKIATTLEKVRNNCSDMKVLGSFPAAR
jgi:chorismate mutase / prephenate dehydratase